MTELKTAERLVSSAIERFGVINVLVNNAGYSKLGNVENASMDDFDGQFNTNLRRYKNNFLLLSELNARAYFQRCSADKTCAALSHQSERLNCECEQRFRRSLRARRGLLFDDKKRA